MPDEQPQPPFIDRAWMQQFTSGALGSAVGTGIVALVVAGVGLATGVIQTDGGVQRLAIYVIGFLFAIATVLGTGALLRLGLRRPAGERSTYFWEAFLALVLGGMSSVTLITAAARFDPHLCEKHPTYCQDSDF